MIPIVAVLCLQSVTNIKIVHRTFTRNVGFIWTVHVDDLAALIIAIILFLMAYKPVQTLETSQCLDVQTKHVHDVDIESHGQFAE